MSEPEVLGLIGRDDVLVRKLAKLVNKAARKHHDYTGLRPYLLDGVLRGYQFDVLIHEPDGPTGHVARITVELDRVNR